ncbi:MAG TPA: hypothetical protein VFC85_08255 [Verrucomicrobiae bacterium]|nr:hypothetical protein [Verrucomicrobiae bacterium]
MDEKPENIWRKSWQGPRGLFLWFILLFVAAFAVIFSIGYASAIVHPLGGLIFFAFLYAICWAFVGVLLVAFIRWLCSWHNFKKFLFGVVCFATLIALFYAEEDWRGKHDWEKFKRRWEAKGERFDWQSIVPPPVPDDQNFAFSPVWIAEEKYTFLNTPKRAEAWYGDRIYGEDVSKIVSQLPVSVSGLVGTNWYVHSTPNLPQMPDVSSHWTTSGMTDLKPWQSYYRDLEMTNAAAEIPVASQPQSPAQDVLLALGKFDPVIEKLRTDSALPYSRFPLGYDGMPAAILLPHLAALKRYSQVLQLRAIAELQNNESQKAFDDVKLSLRLMDSIRTEPFLISHLVRIAILQITLQPIYEGLAEHKWSDAQLADLDSELAKLDFLADCQFAIRGERGLEIANIEFIRHPHDLVFKRPRLYFLAPFFSVVQMLSNLSSDEGENPQGFQMFALGFGPSGWLVQNELRLAQFDTKWYLPIVGEDAKTISPAKTRAASEALGKEIRPRTPENILETLFIPNWRNAAEKFAYAQSSANLARVAIALERYHVAHGNFPDSLAALAPQFMAQIPHDVIGGEPLHYRKTSDGQFVLYSVGWNETDDGGVVVFKNGSPPVVDRDKGDWVWCYPQK